MKLTITTHLWLPKLGAFIHSLLGFAFDLTGLTIDQEELDLDLQYGRE